MNRQSWRRWTAGAVLAAGAIAGLAVPTPAVRPVAAAAAPDAKSPDAKAEDKAGGVAPARPGPLPPGQHRITLADGTVITGKLAERQPDGRLVIVTADGRSVDRSLEDLTLLELGVETAVAARPDADAVEVWLPAGGMLRGRIAGAGPGADPKAKPGPKPADPAKPAGKDAPADGAAEATPVVVEGDLGRMELPFASLRAIRFPGREAGLRDEAARLEAAAAFGRALADQTRNDDVLFAMRGNDLVQLPGFASGFRGAEFAFRYQGRERTMARDKVYAVVISGRAARAAGVPANCRVTGVGGSTADLEMRGMADGKIRLLGPLGIDVRVPVANIARIEFRNSRIIELAGRERDAASVRTAPAFGGEWPVLDGKTWLGTPTKLGGRTVKGLCMRPLTEVRYDLARIGEGFQQFRAVVGVDDSAAAAGGKVTFEVLADGKSVFRSADTGSIPAGSPPVEVVVPLEGVKVLVLRADFGAGPPVGQVAVWGDARLVRQ